MSLKSYLFGFSAEDRAVKFLKERDFKILERNFRSKFGEIDIVAKRGEIYHFIEVKATAGAYEPICRITKAKLDKILLSVEIYLAKKQILPNFQLDAITITGEEINLLENITI